ncbi:VIT and vWA domain-containing protein [Oceanidesulfovibrio marinus]|uniref:Ca-activated chloride channel family protein n=1 Tax=Oceanidesulfovibrio marinus TaxID=370038 RepID=A0A6P1ZF22_9BACT|nr:VIT and VWA domain-containing protein [Oceanidesulfovibrio marinus]TVM31229.1 hypothetical protein DQK91_19155 [Oceanidesulfovibrio marinus]
MCSKMFFILMMAAVGFVLLAFTGRSEAAETELRESQLAGSIEAVVNNRVIQFPSLHTDIRINIQGDMANVEVVQKFANPTTIPMNATYLFPLNKDAAVHAMTMEVGNEIVRATIHEKREAKEQFEKAKAEGKSAALLVQHRPNMFTQNLANLMPGLPITVRMEYVQPVLKVDGEYELIAPLVVGPRYQPAEHMGPPPSMVDVTGVAQEEIGAGGTAESSAGQWQLDTLPAYPEVAGIDPIPDTIDFDRVSIRVTLDGGMPISTFYSPTHTLYVDTPSDERCTAQLATGSTIDNRDFILRYGLDGQHVQAGLLTYKQGEDGMFSLLLEAPKTPATEEIASRELVFVLDTSGSMNGLPMQASKAFMRSALQTLRPNDYFRIVRFSNSASQFANQPLRADPGNLNRARNFVDTLAASGGTEVRTGINCALDTPQAPNTLRIVVFLTDGYIGNEAEVLRLLQRRLGRARLYAFGVGTSVNRYLLSEMTHIGRGFVRVLDPTENFVKVAADLAAKLDSPVLTDIHVDWGGLQVADVTPPVVPDLFAGQSVRIQGRYANPGPRDITVSGLVNGRKATLTVHGDFPTDDTGPERAAIPLIWARSLIRDNMRLYNTPAGLASDNVYQGTYKDRVIELGLKYSLMTRWTSFVAVTEKRYNTQGTAVDKNVPLPMVKGVKSTAYPNAPGGGIAPEPATTLGMLLLGALGGLGVLRRKFWGEKA